MKSLGNGNTSQVFLCQSIAQPSQFFALKLMKKEFLARGVESLKAFEKEIEVLSNINHANIVKIISNGKDGIV